MKPPRRSALPLPIAPSAPASLPPWFVLEPGRALLRIHVQPGARRTAVEGTHDDRLKIALATQPVGGAANAALIELLAQICAVPRQAIRVQAGLAGRRKTVAIDHVEPGTLLDRVHARLAEEAAPVADDQPGRL